ncbi:XRE family transcriptional regulator [Geobacillus sp. MMMUD3]|nr:XRE family transcriptional regulator [Geobacillus sp. MMMUD3]
MFPNRLKMLRLQKKLTHQDMADFLGITRQGYSKYENGQSQPDIDTINKLAEFFNVTTDYLLGRTDHPNPPEQDDELGTLARINQLIKEYGIEQMGFFDIKKWKQLSEEEIKEIVKHFEWVVHKAKEKNKAAREDAED